jgi:phage shock protein PspC (stress-responsive transcriptional regulator)
MAQLGEIWRSVRKDMVAQFRWQNAACFGWTWRLTCVEWGSSLGGIRWLNGRMWLQSCIQVGLQHVPGVWFGKSSGWKKSWAFPFQETFGPLLELVIAKYVTAWLFLLQLWPQLYPLVAPQHQWPNSGKEKLIFVVFVFEKLYHGPLFSVYILPWNIFKSVGKERVQEIGTYFNWMKITIHYLWLIYLAMYTVCWMHG